MSNPVYAAVPSAFATSGVTFVATDGTAAKPLVEAQQPAAAGSTSPALYGGASVFDLTGTSTDAASKPVQFLIAKPLTIVDAATGTVAATPSAITRTVGSFIADGWRAGDLLMVFAPDGEAKVAGVEGVMAIVASVTALSLNFSGTPLGSATLPAGTRVCDVQRLYQATVTAGAGTAPQRSEPLLDVASNGSNVRPERKLGAGEILAVAMAQAVSALPAYVHVNAQFARY
jgi:hypothetical protein